MAPQATRMVKAAITSGGEQNFLGARWVAGALRHTPPHLRRPLALWLLSLSPHYFYDRDRQAEARRNEESRAQLVRDLLAPVLRADLDVLDYGCGPGYMARAVGPQVHRLDAVDLSAGVIACAEVLNPGPNIHYDTVAGLRDRTVHCDLVYSFAVAQHLTDSTLRQVLSSIAGWLRPGGLLYLHVVLSPPGWRDEQSWRADRTLRGQLRLRHGLHCFARTEQAVYAMAAAAGFVDVSISPLAGRTTADPDIAGQHLLTARMPAPVS